jgi:hypothetical protein
LGVVGGSRRAQISDAPSPDSGAGPAAPAPAAVTTTTASASPSVVVPLPAPSVSLTAAAGKVTGPPVTVTVVHDGKSDIKTSTGTTVGTLLQQLGLSVSSLDKVSPGLGSGLVNGLVVQVDRITQSLLNHDIQVPFHSVTRNSTSLELGTQSVAQQGANGVSRQVFRQTFQDGKLLSTVLATTQVLRQPRDKIILIGTHQPTFVPHGGSQSGLATWYAGAPGLTSASPFLPFGTVVRVTNNATGRSIDVVIRDRGPYAGPDKIIDLSPTAFQQIAPLGTGVIDVSLRW